MFEQEGGKFRKFENLKQQKSILGETKSIFNSFKGVFGKVIADTSYKKTMIERNRIIFFYYLAALWPDLGYYQVDSLILPMLITTFIQVLTRRSSGTS